MANAAASVEELVGIFEGGELRLLECSAATYGVQPAGAGLTPDIMVIRITDPQKSNARCSGGSLAGQGPSGSKLHALQSAAHELQPCMRKPGRVGGIGH